MRREFAAVVVERVEFMLGQRVLATPFDAVVAVNELDRGVAHRATVGRDAQQPHVANIEAAHAVTRHEVRELVRRVQG